MSSCVCMCLSWSCSVFFAVTTLGDNPSMTPYTSQSGLAGRKAGPPQVRPGLSEGCEGNAGGGRRQRLSLLDDLQEEEVSTA